MAVLDYQDQIRVANSAEPVRNHHARAALEQRTQSLLDEGLGAGVYVARCFIQYQDARVGKYRPGEGDELALALAQSPAALSQTGVVAVWENCDKVVGADGAGCSF